MARIQSWGDKLVMSCLKMYLKLEICWNIWHQYDSYWPTFGIRVDVECRRTASPLPQADIFYFFLVDLPPWVPRRSITFSAHPLWAQQNGWRRQHEIKSNLALRSNTSERRCTWDTLCFDDALRDSRRYRWRLGGGRDVFERLKHGMRRNSHNQSGKITMIWQRGWHNQSVKCGNSLYLCSSSCVER